jgi:hypothetical protein
MEIPQILELAPEWDQLNRVEAHDPPAGKSFVFSVDPFQFEQTSVFR